MMKRLFAAALVALALTGCKSIQNLTQPRGNPYEKRMFYEKYLNPGNPIDARIISTLGELRKDPKSASLHNELGQLLRQRGFPKDAEREFERAVDSDAHFYPGWYNLGLLREARGNYPGARFAFNRTIKYKPGHPSALFQLGLMEEHSGHNQSAIEYYAKAFSINHSMLDVRVNPRLLDSRLIDLALLKLYPTEHARGSTQFQPTNTYVPSNPAETEAASKQPTAQEIVAPSAPVTSPATQTPPPPKPPL
jgi:tetratricopeptide (TPR) repeat protein